MSLKIFNFTNSLTVLVVCVVSSTCSWYFWPRFVTPDSRSMDRELARLQESFRSKFHAISVFQLSELKQTRLHSSLADPASNLPQTHLYSSQQLTDLRKILQLSKNCHHRADMKLKSQLLKKAFVWHQFRCGTRTDLPPHFFENKPFIHPSGASFVSLAHHSDQEAFSSASWLAKHSEALHLLEFMTEPTLMGFELTISNGQLKNLLDGESTVMTDSHVFILSMTEGTHDPGLNYHVYPLGDWIPFYKSALYTPSAFFFSEDSRRCSKFEGNVCWSRQMPVSSIGNLLGALLFVGFAYSLIGFGVEGFRKAKQKKKEMAQRLFTLQLLTHELRTPVTSLRLSLEILRNEFDSLPIGSQQAFLRMSEELQRLDRMISASKCYLGLDLGPPAVEDGKWVTNLNIVSVSINPFLNVLLEPYENKLKWEPLNVDQHISLDPYWAELCIRNIVENALNHGKPPVMVKAHREGDGVVISIHDHGAGFNISNLKPWLGVHGHKQSFRVFNKGLGLGLSIVQRVLPLLNAELKCEKNPTVFSIKFKSLA